MNTQSGVLAKNGINYMILEEGDKMYLQVCEGKNVVKFPITKEVISTLNWLVDNDTAVRAKLYKSEKVELFVENTLTGNTYKLNTDENI